MKDGKLYISVSADDITDVRVWMIDAQTGEEKELTEGMHFTLELVQARPDRCQVCDRSYPASEIVHRGSEHLCLSCDLDKYPIREEDIPF